jgi:hypothetical protein
LFVVHICAKAAIQQIAPVMLRVRFFAEGRARENARRVPSGALIEGQK